MMIFSNQAFLWFLSAAHVVFGVQLNVVDKRVEDAKNLLDQLNQKSVDVASNLVQAQWDFEKNNTDDTKKKFFQISLENIQNTKRNFENVLKNYPWRSFTNPDIQRQLKFYSEIGILALPTKEYEEFQRIISDLGRIEQNTTICDYFNKTKCDLHLQPDIEEKLKTSQNSEELLYLHKEWKKATEEEFMNLLDEYYKFWNRAALLNHYANFKEYSLRNIEIGDVRTEVMSLWSEIKPLYSQIHAYVRRKLREIHGEKLLPEKGSIPSHFLGNIWLENWSGIVHKMIPFPEFHNLNITKAMLNQNYTPEQIYQLAEDYFLSMNFSVPHDLWLNYSSKSDESKESKNCHYKIFNFYKESVRIQGCKEVSIKNFLSDIGALTKALYMLQYSHQPYVYQTPADPGLETALKDLIMMSASTFNNYKKIGLFQGAIREEIRINRLFKLAMEKVTAIPFLLVQELWRWEISKGKSVKNTISTLEQLREKFQGISTFTKELSFDPGGSGSAFSKLSLVHQFLSYFIEFQIYDTLCKYNSKDEDSIRTLDECNLFGNVQGGMTLRNIMNLGSSKSLKETLAPILGENKIDSRALLKYFEPLTNWLKKDNERTGEYVGWESKEIKRKNLPRKRRRKRSIDEYTLKSEFNDDTFNAASKVLDRFQRVVRDNSIRNEDKFELSEKQRKSRENEQERNEKAPSKNINVAIKEEKENTNAGSTGEGKNSNLKTRRFATKNNKNVKDIACESENVEEKENDNGQILSKYRPDTKIRRTACDYMSQSIKDLEKRDKANAEKSGYLKRRETHGNNGIGMMTNFESSNDKSNDDQMRFVRKARKKQRHVIKDNSLQNQTLWERRLQNQYENNIERRGAKWHTNVKKDISRLLHSFGFAVENDDKDKIKELKKKLKGDSNSNFKSNIASKESSYESMIDYNRLKAADGKDDGVEEKGTNKLWSVKSFMSENAKAMQGNPSLEKKDVLSSSQMSSALVGDEKSIGKKETSTANEPSLVGAKERIMDESERRMGQNGEVAIRHFNIDVPSLQALLKNADFNSYGQKPVYAISSEISNGKTRSEVNQMAGSKGNAGKYMNSYVYKYGPNVDTMQYKDKKEFRDDTDGGSKSPYIIILGEVAPDKKERFLKEKGNVFIDGGSRQSQLQSGPTMEETKISDKRSRASEQIYVVPIDLKNTQQNLLKFNHYAEHEHEAGHDPNTERDRETEEEQLNLEDKSNLYRTGKESPSELRISWNDKNRKIVKRSKREHKKEIKDEDKLKVVRIAPIKDSILEGLFGKAADQGTAAITSSELEQSPSRQDSYQSSSSLSSLASSVLSALSPKGYSKVVKAANQVDLDEDNTKENGAVQAIGKEVKEQELPFLASSGLRCNVLSGGKKKGAKFYSDDEKKLTDLDAVTKDDACCKKIILTPCPPKCPPPCPTPCPCPIPCPPPCPSPCPEPDNKSANPSDITCRKPSECSLVNCQFKITKAKKPHERLTIMIYDRINPPAELPEPYDALAVISEILQRIQCCSTKPCCQLTEEDPDYPANDNSDQLKGNQNQGQELSKAKIQELSGEIPILGAENPEEDETDDNPQNSQNSPNSDEDKYQPREKATPALDQLTVFNKDKLKPVFIDLRKIDDIIKKRSQQG